MKKCLKCSQLKGEIKGLYAQINSQHTSLKDSKKYDGGLLRDLTLVHSKAVKQVEELQKHIKTLEKNGEKL